MLKKVLSICLAGATLGLASCTLSEPDEVSGDAADLRFAGYTSYGVKLMAVSYDDNGRVTEIKRGSDYTYTLSYIGSSTVPSEIVCEEYASAYNSEEDKEVRYLSEQSSWTGIQPKNGKYLGKFNVVNTYYADYNASAETTYGTMEFIYDAEGHITQEIIIETTGGITDTKTRNFVWNNDGLLTEWRDGTGISYKESAEYAYSDVENVRGQWDPNNNVFGPLTITGLLGNAPSRFMRSEKMFRSGSQTNFCQYAYVLMDNGLIKMAKMSGDDGDDDVALVFNFQYEKK